MCRDFFQSTWPFRNQEKHDNKRFPYETIVENIETTCLDLLKGKNTEQHIEKETQTHRERDTHTLPKRMEEVSRGHIWNRWTKWWRSLQQHHNPGVVYNVTLWLKRCGWEESENCRIRKWYVSGIPGVKGQLYHSGAGGQRWCDVCTFKQQRVSLFLARCWEWLTRCHRALLTLARGQSRKGHNC